MKIELTQGQIGRRIMELRKRKGFSQDELAKSIGISRPSMVQIELGNRNLDVRELMKLSIVIGFSLDDFISEDFNVVHEIEAKYDVLSEKVSERVSAPDLNLEKFKNVVLYISEQCAGKPNVSETFLCRMLYFADFNYYELYEEHLTGAGYRKLQFGPVPVQFQAIIGQMIGKGLLYRIKAEYSNKVQTRYIPLQKADLTALKASEKEVIDQVINRMSEWSESAITNYSHQDMPWVATKEGEEINYELAFYRETPFSVRNYELENDAP